MLNSIDEWLCESFILSLGQCKLLPLILTLSQACQNSTTWYWAAYSMLVTMTN